jgi:hypothetical protein
MGTLKPPALAKEGSMWRGLFSSKLEWLIGERVDFEMGSLLVVTAETVDSSLVFSRLLLGNSIGSTTRWLVSSSAGATVGGLPLAAKATASTEEDCHFVVEDRLAVCSVHGGHTALENSSVTLVNDLNEVGLRDESAGGGNRVFLDLKVLLAVEKHHRRKVGDQFIDVVRGLGVERRDDTECGNDLKVICSLTIADG